MSDHKVKARRKSLTSPYNIPIGGRVSRACRVEFSRDVFQRSDIIKRTEWQELEQRLKN